MSRSRLTAADQRANYRDNLLFCCDHYRSISDLCRRVGINRQQFNRYLSGESLPSRHNHKKISDFFGLEFDELLLPHRQFIATFGRRKVESFMPPDLESFSYFMKSMAGPRARLLEDYQGFYFRHFFNFHGDGRIKRELVHWRLDDGVLVSTTKQRYMSGPGAAQRLQFVTYRGVVGSVGDRLFSIGADRIGGRDLGMSMLYPTVQKLQRLEGIMMGIGPNSARQIVSGRVVLDFLGRRIDRRDAMRRLGTFALDDPAVADDIKASIQNDISPTEGLLIARI
ncbi:helix-turn-helix domain-containing protein [Acuticoccus sediminis]|uniref:helix-turn-helix domain-containing protein n=1 Tax=Acuticoccus sediminis TaxID=2184697 RepID=UPI001CFE740A|nr:helix-turn-helix transcriptional regulator [Acuticoccus sediminis]